MRPACLAHRVPCPQGPPLELADGLPPVDATAILREVFGKSDRDTRLRQLVDKHVGLVARVLRNAGTAEADIDDDVQRVFIALSNRLTDVRVGAEKSFLVQTALNMAAHARRTAVRRRELLTDRPPELIDATLAPDEVAHRRQLRRTLDQVLGEMDDDLRAVFVLYEFEEMTTAEIAVILQIPSGTVASRLRRARVDFRDRVGMLEGLSKTEVG
jgi:RNA polymerase sigma-70 factor (ECF subfamily)